MVSLCEHPMKMKVVRIEYGNIFSIKAFPYKKGFLCLVLICLNVIFEFLIFATRRGVFIGAFSCGIISNNGRKMAEALKAFWPFAVGRRFSNVLFIDTIRVAINKKVSNYLTGKTVLNPIPLGLYSSIPGPRLADLKNLTGSS
jgi:hypothetical protein